MNVFIFQINIFLFLTKRKTKDRENAALAEKKQKLEDRTEKARAIAPQRIETTKQPGELIAERDAMQAKLESDRRQ